MRVLNKDTGAVVPGVEHKESLFEKMMGLRFRREGRAFFSFDQPTREPFDMAFVLGPLDIAFLNEDMEVMEVHGALPLSPNPVSWRLYRPDEPYQYVLETEHRLMPYLGFEEGHELELFEK